MLRLLIRDITVVKGPEPKLLRLHIRWQGGTTETVELHLAPNRAEAVRYHDTFVTQIRALAAKHDDDEIVALLNRDDLTSSTGKPFTVSMIRWIRYKHRIPGPSLPAGTFSVSQVRERYGVSMWVVYYWIDRGLITAPAQDNRCPAVVNRVISVPISGRMTCADTRLTPGIVELCNRIAKRRCGLHNAPCSIWVWGW